MMMTKASRTPEGQILESSKLQVSYQACEQPRRCTPGTEHGRIGRAEVSIFVVSMLEDATGAPMDAR
jgi:hypothetical protein